ncbi:hypothetical protein DFS33DRAFT_1260962 [Desarmillaria ectypa]|nr:hypothetical protein DFS33DRAFT_1260962 [Desarmillaria ectypa]
MPSSTTTPEFTAFSRVISIPLIQSSLEAVSQTLATNAYTKSPYSTAKGLSTSAYKYTEPIQVRLAPYIASVDGYANKAVDVVESRYPYAFTAKPGEVAELVRERRASASKAIDEKVRQPAFHVAQGIDQQFTPLLNYVEGAYTRISPESQPSSPTESKYQYQRALALSKSIKDQLYGYSNEQIKQIQAHSILIQKATETSHSISVLASSSITNAQTRIHTLSDNMLAELQKLQASSTALAASLQNSATSTLHNSTTQLQTQIPPHVQELYNGFSQRLTTTITDLRTIVSAKDMPLPEKVGRVGAEVREQVSPLLDNLKATVTELLARGRAAVPGSPSSPPTVNGINGHAQ